MALAAGGRDLAAGEEALSGGSLPIFPDIFIVPKGYYTADRQDLQWCTRESTWLAVCSRKNTPIILNFLAELL